MSRECSHNILFFFTDDQRFDTLRAWGNEAIHTPNLDALAAQGTSLRNAYIMGGTCGAVCMPSRAMLMTGRGLFQLEGEGQSIPDDHTMLGEVLGAAGYRTFGTGKWHNGPAAFNRSFGDGDEIFFGGMGDHWNVPANHYDPTGQYETTLPECVAPMRSNKVRRRRCDHVEAGKHSTELFADATIRFLDQQDDSTPFFAYCAFMAPHDPRTMPAEFLEMYDPESIELPPNFMGAHPFDNGELKVRDELLEDFPRTPEAVRRHIAEYYAMISHLDAEIGRVMQTLRERGLAENTIVVFAGDNGLAVGRHGLMGKQSMYEHSVHVPLIFSGPGIPEGESRDALCYLLDIYPTLCDLCGLETPKSVEGRSLAPVLGDASASHREHLFFAYRHVQRSVREGRHKLIEYVVEGRRTTQLFDLEADPWELNNRAADPAQAETIERLRGILLAEREVQGDTREQEASFWDGYGVSG